MFVTWVSHALDSELTFADNISLLTRSCYYQLRRLRAIRRSVSAKVFLTIVHSFVCSRIDYCNSLLIGLPKTRLAPLQTVLNAAARMIARLPPYSHISDYITKAMSHQSHRECIPICVAKDKCRHQFSDGFHQRIDADTILCHTARSTPQLTQNRSILSLS